jgi:hypothetical protein
MTAVDPLLTVSASQPSGCFGATTLCTSVSTPTACILDPDPKANQKRLDFDLAEPAWISPVMESIKMPNPMNVGFLRSMAVVFETNPLLDNLQQHRLF